MIAIKALFISIMAGTVAALSTAVILAVANLILSGRGNDILVRDFFNGPIIYGGIGDLVIIIVTSLAITVTFVKYFKLVKNTLSSDE